MTEFLKTILLLMALVLTVKAKPSTNNKETTEGYQDTASDFLEISAECLYCICEASSHCNANMGCSKPFFGGFRCGPFSISWHYWADAGRPVINNDQPDSQEGFENCVNDLFCAAETMRRYMIRFARRPRGDCDGNHIINCEDFIRIHMMGGYRCNQDPTNLTRYRRFLECYQHRETRDGNTINVFLQSLGAPPPPDGMDLE